MDMNEMESFQLYYIQHTPKAILVSIYSEEERQKDFDLAVEIMWLPLSQIEFEEPNLDLDSLRPDQSFDVIIPAWLARKNNLL